MYRDIAIWKDTAGNPLCTVGEAIDAYAEHKGEKERARREAKEERMAAKKEKRRVAKGKEREGTDVEEPQGRAKVSSRKRPAEDVSDDESHNRSAKRAKETKTSTDKALKVKTTVRQGKAKERSARDKAVAKTTAPANATIFGHPDYTRPARLKKNLSYHDSPSQSSSHGGDDGSDFAPASDDDAQVGGAGTSGTTFWIASTICLT